MIFALLFLGLQNTVVHALLFCTPLPFSHFPRGVWRKKQTEGLSAVAKWWDRMNSAYI
jgi:hypothetical protein